MAYFQTFLLQKSVILNIHTYPDITKNIEFSGQEINYFENFTNKWVLDIKEKQVLTYNGLITFSESGETDYKILVSIFDPARGTELVGYSMLVAFRENIGQVYYSGEVPPPLNPDLTPAYDEATRNFYLTQDALATPSP